MRGDVTHSTYGNPLSKAKSDRRAKRIAQIAEIGRKAAENKDENLTQRAAASLVAKGADKDAYEFDHDKSTNSRISDVSTALKTGTKIKIKRGGGHNVGIERERITREQGDAAQKYMSKQRRKPDRNTF